MQSPPSPEELTEEGQGLGHGHGYLFDEAGQVYVPFRKAGTLMGAQRDVDLEQNQRFGPEQERVRAAGLGHTTCSREAASHQALAWGLRSRASLATVPTLPSWPGAGVQCPRSVGMQSDLFAGHACSQLR